MATDMDDAQQSSRGATLQQQQCNPKLALGSSHLGSSSQQMQLGQQLSPVKSSAKARRQLPVLLVDTGKQLDDVDDAPDSTRANDQREQQQLRSSPPQQQQPRHQQLQQQQSTPVQATTTAPSDGKSYKYIQLLNIASATGQLQSKSKLPSSTSSGMPAAARQPGGTPTRALTGAPLTSSSSAGTAENAHSLLRSSIPAGSSSSLAAKSTPIARATRSRASILDSSPGPSLIPTSPAAAAAPASPERPPGSRPTSSSSSSSVIQFSPSKRPDWSTGAKSSEVAGSPVRRSLCSATAVAAARPQYAFGSRIDTGTTARKPSPMRQSAPSPSPMRQTSCVAAPAARSRASPQRVPAAARSAAAAAASGPMRSASAPRMTSAEKVQSRFAQHQTSAAAAQRSKTPNPAARASGVTRPGAAGSSPTVTGSRARPGGQMPSSCLASSTSHSRHIARMRASDAGGSRLPGSSSSSSSSAARSASPASRISGLRASIERSPGSPAAVRGVSRSLPAAGGVLGSKAANSTGSPTKPKAAAAAAAGSPILLKPVAPTGQRIVGPRAERVSALAAASAAAESSSKAASVSSIGIPTLQDRYRSGYKHTPAAIAVAEARAAAAAAAAAGSPPAAASTGTASTAGLAVPKLSLGTLLKSPATPGLLRTRTTEGSDGDNASSSIVPSAIPGKAAAGHGSNNGVSPFLGRVSAPGTMAGVAPITAPVPVAQKQQQCANASMHTPQLQRGALPAYSGASAPAPGTPIPPSLAETPSDAAVPQLVEPAFVTPPAGEQTRHAAPAMGERMSPPLLPRELSSASVAADGGLSHEAPRDLKRESCSQLPCLSIEGSAASMDSAAVAVAARGIVLPLHRIEGDSNFVGIMEFSSPPKHRRGEQGSPKGAAAVCSQLLKSKASRVCSSSKPASTAATTGQGATATPAPVARAAASGSADSHDVEAAKDITPAANSTSKTLSFSPGDSKLKGLVPRLDLTPVLAQAEEDQMNDQEQQQAALEMEAQQVEQPHLLLLEHMPQAEQEEELHRSRQRPGAYDGIADSSGSGARRGASSGRRPTSGSSKRSSAAAEPPPQESFYVYESVVPAEETRTYEELRRELLKCRNGNRLATNLQGIWGCYQDARRNTEAMAFRGHRLLDQVSNEYCAYKRDAEQSLVQLQQERDAYKEDLQLALSGVPVGSRDVEIAKRDKQVRELQQENQHLHLQMAEMEKALQKAADYHHAQQADQVPMKARTIAESATTSILLQQNLVQQQELLESKKQLAEMKAALYMACTTLEQTNYMESNGPVRAAMEPDALQVVDTLLFSTRAEASMIDQAHAAAGVAQPHVEIEELH